MNSRMEKYYDTDTTPPKRTERNQELYKEVSSSEIDKFKINSNASILEEDGSNINIDELKSILEKKYDHAPQRKSIFIEEEETEKEYKKEETTKEYDINAILAKAREEKEEDYEESRFKKITDTQYDILKSLTIPEEKDIKEEHQEIKEGQDELMSLINTITAKEMESTGVLNPLDILADLKGDDNTEVIAPMKEDDELTSDIDNSFYTTSASISKEDLMENEDMMEDDAKIKPITIVFLVLAGLLFLAGVAFLANKYFNLGLF